MEDFGRHSPHEASSDRQRGQRAVGGDGHHRRGDADCLHQRREPDAGAHRGAAAGTGDSRGAGCRAGTHSPRGAGRVCAAGADWRRGRRRDCGGRVAAPGPHRPCESSAPARDRARCALDCVHAWAFAGFSTALRDDRGAEVDAAGCIACARLPGADSERKPRTAARGAICW